MSEVCTAQKMKFSVQDFVSKCDQIRVKLQIWLQKTADMVIFTEESLMENFVFCAVVTY